MNRSLTRTYVVFAVILCLSFATMPASARSFETPSPALKAPTAWIDAALTWISQLIIPQGGKAPADRGTRQKATQVSDGGPVMSVHTGSCIDPDGDRVPCSGI